MNDIFWGNIHLEHEVEEWLSGLGEREFGRTAFYLDLLAERGPLLSEPYTRQLDGKLRELRFHLGVQQVRVTYWIAPGRNIVMLTVFIKTKRRDAGEVMRARRAMWKCRESHRHGQK